MTRRLIAFLLSLVASLSLAPVSADDGDDRAANARAFHESAQQRCGVLVPMYVYPANIHTNEAYNRLIEIKREFETVPMWVIVNPASGPGEQVDQNYVKAIDRLIGAGCVVLGYVTTSYGRREAEAVQQDIDAWREMYPRAHGIFFDEMTYEDTETAAAYQAALNDYARDAGYWPTVANPGADTPGRYFELDAADVIVVHEGDAWPTEERLHGDYFGGYADHPPFTRAMLLYSQDELDTDALQMARRYVRWVYITEDEYRPNDPDADNPWDTLSAHMEAMCRELAE
jgi:hypothetical protein